MLQELKDLSDRILKERGKSICKQGRSVTSFRTKAYRALEKAAQGTYKSWLLDTVIAVQDAMQMSQSRDAFIQVLEDKGNAVNWKDSRKYITFVTPDGKKVRDKTAGQGVLGQARPKDAGLRGQQPDRQRRHAASRRWDRGDDEHSL